MPYQSDRYLVQYRRRKMFVYKGARDAQNGKGTSSLTVKLKMSRDVSAVGSDVYLASLTRRLEVLEKKLIGKHGLRRDFPPLYPAVQTCQQKLEESIDSGNQVTIHSLWNKLNTLEQLLDPTFQKASKISHSAKEDLLLGYVGQLEPVVGSVEELHRLKDYINTTEFQGLEAHERRLASVASVHSQQEMAVEEMSQQAGEIMKAYSLITLQMSAQCVKWGEDLDKLECPK